MTEPFGRVGRLLRELKRRNVYRVAVTYLALAFVTLQAVDILIPDTRLPPWTDQLLIALVVAGFPVAVVVAWAFEMTADGVRLTPDAEEGDGGADGAPGPLSRGSPPRRRRSLRSTPPPGPAPSRAAAGVGARR